MSTRTLLPRSRHLAVLTLLVAVAVAPAAVMAPAAAAPTPAVSYSDRTVVLGTLVTATVARSSRPQGTDLVLERKYLDRWRVADRTATSTKTGFVLEVPTGQIGSFTYRVVAKDGASVVSTSSTSTVTVRPRYKPVGKAGQHAFNGDPRIRWDSCQKIRWTFNPSKAPKNGLKQVKQGVQRIQQATGLRFRYVGKTDQKPHPYGRDLDGAEVIIGWRTAQDYPAFDGKTVGVGGNSYLHRFREADGTEVNKAISGGVVLNASMKSQLKNGFGKGFTWGEVIVHELGHVLGLAHPEADRQIMYYSVIPRNANWGAGDLAGLRKVGNVRGCLEAPAARVTGRVGGFSEF